MISRRAFLGTLAGGLLAAPLTAEAQQPGKIYRIGILIVEGAPPLAAPTTAVPLWAAFWQRMREHGYVAGQNLIAEVRSAEGRLDRLPDLAAELARLKVDVIVVPVCGVPEHPVPGRSRKTCS